jgi:endonuclease YncB( thermonuclease family)
VRRGIAWVYVRYLRGREPVAIEAEARSAKRGVWADAMPAPPWDWRNL